MDHGVLAAHVVGGDGEVAAELLGVADDVEVLGGGLDHDDVGALADVSGDGAAGETAAPGRELVALAIAERGRGHGGVAEGPVQAAGELGSVGHEQGLVGDALLDQLQLDGADAAVVHVGGRDAVGARLRVGHGDVADAVHGELVVERAVVTQDAAVAVRGVLAEADVDGDEELREALAQESDGLHDGALGVVGRRAEGVFAAGLQGHTEQDDGLQAFAHEGLEEGDELVEAAAVLPGEGGDQGLVVFDVGDEERVDEHGLCSGPAVSRDEQE